MSVIRYLKTNLGVMLISSNQYESYEGRYLNGTVLERFGFSDNPKYFLARGVFEPQAIGDMKTETYIDHYKLIDVLPSYMDREYFKETISEEGYNSSGDYRPFYRPVQMQKEPKIVNVNGYTFKAASEAIYHISEEVPNEIVSFNNKRDVYSTVRGNELIKVCAASRLTYDDWVKALVPGFLWHEQPCTISSNDLYKIVRGHIKENINPKYAEITSDYDFCFTVKKKIQISSPYEKATEQKRWTGKQWKSYKKPKWNYSTVTTKLQEIFEMTNSTDKYKGYTVIEEISGNSAREVVDNLKRYLDNLMEIINMPLEECKCCNGTGHVSFENQTPKGKIV